MTWHDTTIICVCFDFVVFLSLDTTTITSYDRMYVNIPVFVFILTLARKFFFCSSRWSSIGCWLFDHIINSEWWCINNHYHHQIWRFCCKKKCFKFFSRFSTIVVDKKKQGLIFFDHSYTHIHTVYFYGRNSDSFWVCLVCVFMFSHFFISDPYL